MTKALAAAAPSAGNFLEFARFVSVGAVAAAINLLTRYLVDYYISFEAAVLVGYLAGAVFAFVLFQRAIFGDPGTPIRRQLRRFATVNLLGLCLTLCISSFLARIAFPAIDWTFHPYLFAHFIGVCAPAFTSYILHKRYTYADN